MRGLSLVLFLAGGINAIALAATPVTVVVIPDGNNQNIITLDTQVRRNQTALWKVLTDYDHHAGVLPYMVLSRIVEQTPAGKVVEQEGRLKILFWIFTMQVKQRVHEDAPQHMHFEAFDGDFTTLEGDWYLKPLGPDGGSTELQCSFVVQPHRRVPFWAVRMAARHYLASMVQVLAAHAEGNNK